jgi:H+-translocating NAD(P) transhydrogenase subunit alpha
MNGEVTAAGSFPAAKVLVIGAGVAGLAAIGTASNLGAIVRSFDTRLECKEQIESLGGEFLILDFGNEQGGDSSGYAKVMSPEFIAKEMELFREQAKECHIIITTAAIPGMRAPILIKKEVQWRDHYRHGHDEPSNGLASIDHVQQQHCQSF